MTKHKFFIQDTIDNLSDEMILPEYLWLPEISVFKLEQKLYTCMNKIVLKVQWVTSVATGQWVISTNNSDTLPEDQVSAIKLTGTEWHESAYTVQQHL